MTDDAELTALHELQELLVEGEFYKDYDKSIAHLKTIPAIIARLAKLEARLRLREQIASEPDIGDGGFGGWHPGD